MEGRFDAKFDAMEGRLDGKFEAMERKFDIKFEAMEGKLKNLEDKVNDRFERQTELINELGIRMNGVATKFETTSTFPRLLSVTSISFLNAS